MGRKPLPEEMLKENITIRLPKYLIDLLKKELNYNQIIQNLIERFYNKL